MLGLGVGEVIIILVVALVVLGPTKLPQVARQVGKGLREFRRHASDLQNTFDEVAREAEREEIERERKAAVAAQTPAPLPVGARPPEHLPVGADNPNGPPHAGPPEDAVPVTPAPITPQSIAPESITPKSIMPDPIVPPAAEPKKP